MGSSPPGSTASSPTEGREAQAGPVSSLLASPTYWRSMQDLSVWPEHDVARHADVLLHTLPSHMVEAATAHFAKELAENRAAAERQGRQKQKQGKKAETASAAAVAPATGASASRTSLSDDAIATDAVSVTIRGDSRAGTGHGGGDDGGIRARGGSGASASGTAQGGAMTRTQRMMRSLSGAARACGSGTSAFCGRTVGAGAARTAACCVACDPTKPATLCIIALFGVFAWACRVVAAWETIVSAL